MSCINMEPSSEYIYMEEDHALPGLRDNRLDTSPEKVTFGNPDLSDPEILEGQPFRNRRSPVILEFSDTRLVSSIELSEMMEAGMNVISLRMECNSQNEITKLMHRMQQGMQTCCTRYGVANWPVATCCTVGTAMVKSGILKSRNDEEMVNTGERVILTNDVHSFDECTTRFIFVDHQDLIMDFNKGWVISINDGNIILEAIAKASKTSILCKVTKGGMLGNMQNVSFRFKGEYNRRAALAKRDYSILNFAKEWKIDIIIVYYTRTPITIKKIKQYLSQSERRPQIIAAICTQQGLDNVDDILKECDALLLARDFLYWELEEVCMYRIANIQKLIAGKCQKLGKPLFLSGILSSYIDKGLFMYNEVADIVNALFDGVTGFVVRGGHNIERTKNSMKYLNEICCFVEPLTFSKNSFLRLVEEMKMPCNNAEAAVLCTVLEANQANAKVIILPTVSGRTAKALLRLRPTALIITVSSKPETTSFLYTQRNTIPLLYAETKKHKTWEKAVIQRIMYAVDFAKNRRYLLEGDSYVILQRSRDCMSYSDMVRIFTLNEGHKYIIECPSTYEFH